jgi:hypothetical protein
MQSKVTQTPKRQHGSPAFGGGCRASASTNRRGHSDRSKPPCRHPSWRRPRPLAMQSKVTQTPRRQHGSPAFGGGCRVSSSANRRGHSDRSKSPADMAQAPALGHAVQVTQTPKRQHGSPAFGGGCRASASANRRREARSRDQRRDRVSLERSDRPAGELVGGPGVACEFSARPRRVERPLRAQACSPEGAWVAPDAG